MLKLCGVSVEKSCMFDALEKIHVRAAKITFGQDWYTPSNKRLAYAK